MTVGDQSTSWLNSRIVDYRILPFRGSSRKQVNIFWGCTGLFCLGDQDTSRLISSLLGDTKLIGRITGPTDPKISKNEIIIIHCYYGNTAGT